MSDVMTPCPPDHPLMIAWTAWKAGADYQNDLRWIATGPQYVEGALWSAFSAGFNHPPTPPPPSETVMLTDEQREALADFEREMQDVVIPQILKDRAARWAASVITRDTPLNLSNADTWRELHNAWRKRAEQAERELAEYKASIAGPPSETKLSEAIEDLESSAKVLGRVEFLWERDDVVPTYEMENAQKAVNAGRSSLESLYREQMTERDEALASVEASAYELIRLRSLQLTPAEANLLLGAMKHAGYDGPLSEPTREKLQRISSKATSEEL